MSRRAIHDELTAVGQHSRQALEELKSMAPDLDRISPVVQQSTVDAKNFKSPAPSRNVMVFDSHNQDGDPREELSIMQHKLRGALADLDRAGDLLAERRAAIAALLE